MFKSASLRYKPSEVTVALRLISCCSTMDSYFLMIDSVACAVEPSSLTRLPTCVVLSSLAVAMFFSSIRLSVDQEKKLPHACTTSSSLSQCRTESKASFAASGSLCPTQWLSTSHGLIIFKRCTAEFRKPTITLGPSEPKVLEFMLNHHCTTGLDRAPAAPLPSLLSPARVILIRHVTSCFVHEPQLRLLMAVCLHHTHRQFGSGCGDVPLAPLASHLAAMLRGLRHSKPIWFGAARRDARRCGRSRVGWVGGSEIGLEDPAQVGDLRGFIGVLGSPWEWLGGLEVMGEVGLRPAMVLCAPVTHPYGSN